MKRQFLATIALFLVTAQAAFAGQQIITISGTLVRDASGPTLYGNPADSVPLKITFKVDDTLVTNLPANSPVGSGYYFEGTGVKIPKDAISDLTLNIPGANYTAADFSTQSIGQLGAFSVLLSGTLANPTGAVFTFANQAVGEVTVGSFECPDLACSIAAQAYTFSYADGGVGLFDSDLTIASEAVVPPQPVLTAAQKTASLLTTLNAMSIRSVLTKLALNLELKVIQKLIQDNKAVKAKCALDVFKASVKIALKGKALTQAQADILTAGAVDIQSSL